jgi:anaphase-promoting complex subunit 2
VDHGVLKEDPENTFILLEKAEEGDPGVGMTREARVLGSFLSFKCCLSLCWHHSFPVIDMTRSADCVILHVVSAAPEYPPISTMQQQQAEQMQVYWKVSIFRF